MSKKEAVVEIVAPKKYFNLEDKEMKLYFGGQLGNKIQKNSTILLCDITDDMLEEANITVEEAVKEDYENVYKILHKEFKNEDMTKFVNETLSEGPSFRNFMAKQAGKIIGCARFNLNLNRALLNGLTDEGWQDPLIVEVLERFICKFCDTLGVKEVSFDCVSPYYHTVKYQSVNGHWDLVSRKVLSEEE